MSQLSFAQIWDLRPFLRISSESPGFSEVLPQMAVGADGLQSEVRASRRQGLKDFFSKAGFLLIDTKVIHYAESLVTSHYFCNQAFDDQS